VGGVDRGANEVVSRFPARREAEKDAKTRKDASTRGRARLVNPKESGWALPRTPLVSGVALFRGWQQAPNDTPAVLPSSSDKPAVLLSSCDTPAVAARLVGRRVGDRSLRRHPAPHCPGCEGQQTPVPQHRHERRPAKELDQSVDEANVVTFAFSATFVTAPKASLHTCIRRRPGTWQANHAVGAAMNRRRLRPRRWCQLHSDCFVATTGWSRHQHIAWAVYFAKPIPRTKWSATAYSRAASKPRPNWSASAYCQPHASLGQHQYKVNPTPQVIRISMLPNQRPAK
jgi:hypothetical protein